MSLRLLVDEDSQQRKLVSLLKASGHDVVTASDAGLAGRSDNAVLDSAIAEQRIVLTSNCRDFIALAQSYTKKGRSHPGILLVYRDNNPSKDMSAKQLVAAINNLERTQMDINSQIVSLNEYNY